MSLQPILILHKALSDYYHTAHWTVKNTVYYSDHLLLDRLYENADGFIDGLAEKIVGIGEGPDKVSCPVLLKGAYDKVKSLPYLAQENVLYFQAALKLEEELLSLCKAFDADPNSSVGCRNMIGDVADKAEERCYLLKQRIAKPSSAPVVPPQ